MDVFITRFTFARWLPVFFALSLVGCDKSKSSSSTPSQTGQSVRLLLDWKPEPEFGGFYAAKTGGRNQFVLSGARELLEETRRDLSIALV